MDALPIPPVLTGATHNLTANQSTHKFHSDLPAVRCGATTTGRKAWLPGPTIEIQEFYNQRQFTNNLPERIYFR